jgi:hypothetical protein
MMRRSIELRDEAGKFLMAVDVALPADAHAVPFADLERLYFRPALQAMWAQYVKAAA